MKSIIIKSFLAAALLVPFTAGAVPIDGNILIGGSLLPTCGGSSTDCDMNDANGLDFSADQGLVLFADGDFTGMGPTVTMSDFTFDPFAGVNPLWSGGGFSFALDTLNIVTQTSGSLLLTGNGMISNAAFDDTMGIWSFSADASAGSAQFAWSSTTAAPEPGILVLMGLGLIGGLGARRLTRS